MSVNKNNVLETMAAVFLFGLAQVGWAADPLDVWTASSSGITSDLRAVVFGQNKLVAVGANGTIATSPDGGAWTVRQSGGGYLLWGIAYGNPGFVAVGGGALALTSADGAAWTVHDIGVGPLLGVTYLNGRYFAVGGAGPNGAVIVSSPDGVKWTVVLSSATHSNLPPQFDSIAYGNGIYVASHADEYGSAEATSVDGVSWQASQSASLGMAICFGNGVFVGVASHQTRDPVTRAPYSRAGIVTSVNGVNSALRLDIPGYLDAISYGAGGFVAVGGPYGANGSSFDNGVTTLVTSPDGTNWTQRATSPGGFGITCANNQFFLVGGGGAIFRSGVIGKLGASLSNGQFLGTISGLNGQNFAIQTSTDLASWTVLTNVPVSNGIAQFLDPLAGVVGRHFYRAIVINQ